MKKIIVPTDFSANAWNALKYAVNIANQFGSELHVVHAYEVVSTTGMLKSIRDYMDKDALEGLDATEKELVPYLKVGTSIKTKALEGQTADRVCSYAKNVKGDLIVMGTQGASGLKAIFMGSNALAVIKKSEIPVLAIPNNAKLQNLDKMALAIDSEVVAQSDLLSPLTTLARQFNAKVDIVHVVKEEALVTVDAGVDIYLSEVPHEFFVLESDNIKEGIDEFIEKKDSGLLCMIRRDRGFIGNLFHGSVTQKELFDCKIPLLIINEN